MSGITANSASKSMTGSSAAADQALSGWIRNERVTLATSPTGTTYQWALALPSGSSPTKAKLSDDSVAAPIFVPDIGGTYVVTCTVDGTTSYTLRMGVLDTAASEPVEALRFTPRTDAQVAAPSLGAVLYYSSTRSSMAIKLADGSVRTINSTAV